jgi:hypothetical protein
MSSTQTPPYPPPPPSSSQAPPPRAKLSAAAIVGVSGGVVLLGAVLIYFAFLRPAPTPTPPTRTSVHVKVVTQAAIQKPITQSKRRKPPRPSPTTTTTTTHPAPPPSPGAVSLGNGITITPAAGWTTQGAYNNHGAIAVTIGHTNPFGFLFAVADGAQSSISNLMSASINANATANGGDLSNIEVTQGQVTQIAGTPTVFNEYLEYSFTATIVTTQGSYAMVGEFVALENSQTTNSAWVEAYSDSSSDWQTVLSNVTAMLDSMVG